MKGFLIHDVISSNAYDRNESVNISRGNEIPIASEQYPIAQPDLSPLGVFIDGNEGFMDNVKAVTVGAYDKAKFISGETYKAMDQAFNKSTRALATRLGNNKLAISTLKRDVSRNGLKDRFVFTAEAAATLTATGQPSDYWSDAKTLSDTLSSLKKHTQDVQGYLETQLGWVKRLNSIKSNEGAVNLLEEVKSEKLPRWLMAHATSDIMSTSDVLPGGKVLSFEYNVKTRHVSYSMSGNKPSGEAQEIEADKTQVDSVLSQLTVINDVMITLNTELFKYLSLIKRWGDAVKSANVALDHQHGLSEVLRRQLDKVMDGPSEYLLFYSGFLPKVVSYTDRFLQTSIGVNGKLIN